MRLLSAQQDLEGHMQKHSRTVCIELDTLDIEPLILTVIFEAGNLGAPVRRACRISHSVYANLACFQHVAH